MSTASTLEHPPDRSSALPVSSRKTLDQLITAEVACDLSFVHHKTADLIQCCIRRASFDPAEQCVRWEDEIPSEIMEALGLTRNTCNAKSMAEALLAIDDPEQRRTILRTIIFAIVRLS